MPLQKQPKELDEKLIIDNYWDTFNLQFPSVSLDEFKQWINEDYYEGWEDLDWKHAGGRREMKMLFATIRASKPKKILEIGTNTGTSTNHILLAAEFNNREGFPCEVVTIDITDYVTNTLHNYPYEHLIVGSLEHLEEVNDYDFIFQDGDHRPPSVHKELEVFQNMPNLKWVFSHDYYLHLGAIKTVFDNFPSEDIFSTLVGYKEESYNAGFSIGII